MYIRDDKFYGVKSTQNGEQKEFTADSYSYLSGLNSEHTIPDSDVELIWVDTSLLTEHLHTNIPGTFASGDVRSGQLQIASAVGEGAVAARTEFVNIYEKSQRGVKMADFNQILTPGDVRLGM